MEKVKIELECAKEAFELGRALETLVIAVKDAMKDGFQVGQDIPVIITAAITQLPPALDGLGKLPEEMKSTQEFANALYASLTPVIFGLLKK